MCIHQVGHYASVELTIFSKDNWPWGGEPVISEDKIVGNLTSVGYTSDNTKLAAIMRYRVDLRGKKLSVRVGDDLYACVMK